MNTITVSSKCLILWLMTKLTTSSSASTEPWSIERRPPVCLCSLPVFNEEDRHLVKGTYDFFAISHFSTKLVTHAKEDS